MRNSKNLALMLGLLFLACTSGNEDMLTPEMLSRDSIFKSIMEQNLIAKEKFNTALDRSTAKVESTLSTIRKTIDEGDYETLVLQLGYSNVYEFEKSNFKLFSSYQELFKKYPSLERGGFLYKEAVSMYFADLEFKVSEKSDARINSGCEGGVACFRSASNCNHDAEVDFGVSSSMCAGYGWFAPYWGLCQGSANLVYVADVLDCSYQLGRCCG